MVVEAWNATRLPSTTSGHAVGGLSLVKLSEANRRYVVTFFFAWRISICCKSNVTLVAREHLKRLGCVLNFPLIKTTSAPLDIASGVWYLQECQACHLACLHQECQAELQKIESEGWDQKPKCTVI